MQTRRAEVTAILQDPAAAGEAWVRLLPLVYDELRDLAGAQMHRERGEHTLQPTALVHEAWMRLVDDRDMTWSSRRHFFGAAAEAMRRVLVDHARRVRANKRGGDRAREPLTGLDPAAAGDFEQVLAVNDALSVLESEDERAAEVARLRHYAGLSVAETAATLEVSERTVMREWTFARARLSELLGAAQGRAGDDGAA
ncbi:MAG: extracytoplasmic sigma factor ECF [Planctomycetota bacterium]|nr:MAG: extracytoplasmic sigma factor ECF [Planctomycetota bacterium]